MIRVIESEDREKEAESLVKEICENFLNLGRDLNIQVHEANKSHYYFNSKRSLKYILIKLSKIKKNKGRFLKTARERDCNQ